MRLITLVSLSVFFVHFVLGYGPARGYGAASEGEIGNDEIYVAGDCTEDDSVLATYTSDYEDGYKITTCGQISDDYKDLSCEVPDIQKACCNVCADYAYIHKTATTGTTLFQREVQFHTTLQGNINGKAFTVEGKGLGYSGTGKVKGKWVCTSGKLPMSWAALGSTLGVNGFRAFVNFPNNLAHFFQESMPEGYTQERVIRFQDDGTLKTYHEINFQKGVLMNKVTLQGDGFKSDSPVLNDGLKVAMPLHERVDPFEDGVKSLGDLDFPLKSNSGNLKATQSTVNKPLGDGRVVPVPTPFFMALESEQFRDTDDDSDHIVQDSLGSAYRTNLKPGNKHVSCFFLFL
jgi:hypothetical protein